MTTWVNLHNLPRGTHQYTAWVGDEKEADEVDFILASTDMAKVMDAAHEEAFGEPDPMYDMETQAVLQIVDQCCGELVWDGR